VVLGDYDARKLRIPDDYTFELLQYYPWDFKRVWKEVEQNLDPNGPRILGDVFGCAYVMATEDQFHTFWLLEFYGGVCFTYSYAPSKRVVPSP
jgi:hypothetical protein